VRASPSSSRPPPPKHRGREAMPAFQNPHPEAVRRAACVSLVGLPWPGCEGVWDVRGCEELCVLSGLCCTGRVGQSFCTSTLCCDV
jgi:hypothetical protein